MNFIKSIEAALQSINQAKFQDLINHLLHLQGQQFIGAPGSVIAKEKTSKGSPDSFFLNDDGRYVFVECTTQEQKGGSNSFYNKLKKDIEHCFDFHKTKICSDKIETVILACTDKISVEQHQLLVEKVFIHNPDSKLEVLDIQNLPLLIYDFPGLSEQYLGVTIVKGEIYNLPDFLIKTTKGLQPSLINEFVGREKEVNDSINRLQDFDILLYTGPAGVGKSKLAVQVLGLMQQANYIPIVIQSSAVPLWDDFVHLFQNNRDYVILFDDANKSVQNFSYLLEFLLKLRTYRLKLLITVRDYVKQQVYNRLTESDFAEVSIDKFEDKQIQEIIHKVLPNLKYYGDLTRKIVDLSKGNARLALMATLSVKPGSKTNYLANPVLLYEKYFERISLETKLFTKSTTLQAIAIVSFFGVLKRHNVELENSLRTSFGIEWDELWTSIVELHHHEVLDVYEKDVAKVSDQVLATYAFYKCFLDETSAQIDYGLWLSTFIGVFHYRIRETLIDVNNTFHYYLIKDLVTPHLDRLISNVTSEATLYSFYTIFWFYKGYDTLLYLKGWVAYLEEEVRPKILSFTYSANDHSRPSKYFELIVDFWNHDNELLKPALELGIDMVARQPSRLSEFLTFIDGHFSYQIDDLEDGYGRQIAAIEVLRNEQRSDYHSSIAQGALSNLTERLLGWHYTSSTGSSKRHSLNIYNFDLFRSTELLKLRQLMIESFTAFFDKNSEQTFKILQKIVQPGGKVDAQIYINEIPLYKSLIDTRLSVGQYRHCQFVNRLKKHLEKAEVEIPNSWFKFIDSDLMKLSLFLKDDFNDDESWEAKSLKKRTKFKDFIQTIEWEEIRKFIISVEELYIQCDNQSRHWVASSSTEIYIAIGEKDADTLKKALKFYFTSNFSIPLETRLLNFILNRNQLTGAEIYALINEVEFVGQPFWNIALFVSLPEDQVGQFLVEELIRLYRTTEVQLPIHRMLDFAKFDEAFNQYKTKHPEDNIENYTIISYLTKILLDKANSFEVNFGHHLCSECNAYFKRTPEYLKQAYIYLKHHVVHFDHSGKELQAVLDLDNTFFIEYLEQRAAKDDRWSFRLDNFKLDYIWSLESYKDIVNRALKIIVQKVPLYSNSEHQAGVLFSFKEVNDEILSKVFDFIKSYVEENYASHEDMEVVLNVVLHNFRTKFVETLREILILNKDLRLFKSLHLDPGGVYSGSRVPLIQRELELCEEIRLMIRSLPSVLDYADHIRYIDQNIMWRKKSIKEEQKRDFESLD